MKKLYRLGRRSDTKGVETWECKTLKAILAELEYRADETVRTGNIYSADVFTIERIQ